MTLADAPVHNVLTGDCFKTESSFSVTDDRLSVEDQLFNRDQLSFPFFQDKRKSVRFDGVTTNIDDCKVSNHKKKKSNVDDYFVDINHPAYETVKFTQNGAAEQNSPGNKIKNLSPLAQLFLEDQSGGYCLQKEDLVVADRLTTTETSDVYDTVKSTRLFTDENRCCWEFEDIDHSDKIPLKDSNTVLDHAKHEKKKRHHKHSFRSKHRPKATAESVESDPEAFSSKAAIEELTRTLEFQYQISLDYAKERDSNAEKSAKLKRALEDKQKELSLARTEANQMATYLEKAHLKILLEQHNTLLETQKNKSLSREIELLSRAQHNMEELNSKLTSDLQIQNKRWQFMGQNLVRYIAEVLDSVIVPQLFLKSDWNELRGPYFEADKMQKKVQKFKRGPLSAIEKVFDSQECHKNDENAGEAFDANKLMESMLDFNKEMIDFFFPHTK